jgi:hypothetical protein
MELVPRQTTVYVLLVTQDLSVNIQYAILSLLMRPEYVITVMVHAHHLITAYAMPTMLETHANIHFVLEKTALTLLLALVMVHAYCLIRVVVYLHTLVINVNSLHVVDSWQIIHWFVMHKEYVLVLMYAFATLHM